MKRGIGVLFALLIGFTSICTVPERVCAAADNPLVIVLDAGHGGKDSGACSTWDGKKYTEKELNLVIAKYAKEELEQYMGVKVYMTRTDDTYVPLAERVRFAKSKGADLFVSLHNNANSRSSVRGACVYYPNDNYDKMIGESGRQVALSIQKQLANLGLKDRGALYRNSEDYTRYPDRKLADYYAVIRNSKLNGFPGLIVEHSYISNSADCREFLSTAGKLKKLGIADAAGIASAYGLVKGIAPTLEEVRSLPDGSIELTWTACGGMDGYAVYRRKQGKRFVLLAETDGDEETKYVDTTAKEGVTYEYYVKAWAVVRKRAYWTGASGRMEATAIAEQEYPSEVVDTIETEAVDEE